MNSTHVLRLLLLPALACIALCEAGCAKRETPVEVGIRTQTLLVGNGEEPRDLDPQTGWSVAEGNIMPALFEGLTSLDEATGQTLPGVAERWEMSADGLVWTFHLRKDARWSNGDAVTAKDFVYSYQRILSPTLAAPSANMLWPIRNAKAWCEGRVKDINELGVRALDARTLEITLGAACPWLLSLTAGSSWFPVHRATIEKFGSKWTRPGNHVGNGPFKLVEWAPAARVVVTKSATYWDTARNKLAGVVFLPYADQGSEERAFRSGQLHVTSYMPGLPPDKIATYRTQAPAKLRMDPIANPWFLMFNTRKPALDNVKVRQALSRAMNRDAIAANVLRGSGTPGRSLVPPGMGGYASTSPVPDDFVAARRLLAEAGYPGGHGFPTLEFQIGPDATSHLIGEAMQAMWRRELGVTLNIAPVDQKTALQNARSFNYQVGVGGLTADYTDPDSFLRVFVTGAAIVLTGWSNGDYDALIAKSQIVLDRNERQGLQQRAEALLLEEAPIAPIYFGISVYLIDPAVKGWVPSLTGGRRYQTIQLAR